MRQRWKRKVEIYVSVRQKSHHNIGVSKWCHLYLIFLGSSHMSFGLSVISIGQRYWMESQWTVKKVKTSNFFHCVGRIGLAPVDRRPIRPNIWISKKSLLCSLNPKFWPLRRLNKLVPYFTSDAQIPQRPYNNSLHFQTFIHSRQAFSFIWSEKPSTHKYINIIQNPFPSESLLFVAFRFSHFTWFMQTINGHWLLFPEIWSHRPAAMRLLPTPAEWGYIKIKQHFMFAHNIQFSQVQTQCMRAPATEIVSSSRPWQLVENSFWIGNFGFCLLLLNCVCRSYTSIMQIRNGIIHSLLCSASWLSEEIVRLARRRYDILDIQ